MSERFYINCPLQPGPVYLDGPEAHHLSQVCRLRPGNPVHLFNGDGRDYRAVVKEIAKRDVVLEVEEVIAVNRELGFPLEIAAPIPKGDRRQFLLEKLTEIGVTTFTPLMTQRSVINPREGKLEKFERYVIEASKQCGRNVLMQVAPLMSWQEYSQPRVDELRILAHPQEDRTLPDRQDRPVRIAIGPEGGFSDAEIDQARDHGWHFLSLGPTILRLETAALVAGSMFRLP